MQNLKILVRERQVAQTNAKNASKSRPKAFWDKQLQVYSERINKFGQRYSIVQVNVKMSGANNTLFMDKIIYYTDITKEDAIDYTQATLKGSIYDGMKLEVTAMDIPSGRLLDIQSP